MELLPLRGRRRGIRQIGQGLGTLDREVFEAIAESPSPLLDATMPRLSRAADHSKLWLAMAAAIAAFGGPSARRGAARGVLSLAVTSLFTNQVAKGGAPAEADRRVCRWSAAAVARRRRIWAAVGHWRAAALRSASAWRVRPWRWRYWPASWPVPGGDRVHPSR
jgi:hypothetical protein